MGEYYHQKLTRSEVLSIIKITQYDIDVPIEYSITYFTTAWKEDDKCDAINHKRLGKCEKMSAEEAVELIEQFLCTIPYIYIGQYPPLPNSLA